MACDALLTGTGAVLLQKGRPVACEGRKLSSAEHNYTTGEHELFAVVHAMRTWRCYLQGLDFTTVTDHNPLMFLQTHANLSRHQVRWSEYLQTFKFRWQYRPGSINVADSLSGVQVVIVAAVRKGKRKCAELPAPNPSSDPSSGLPSDPGTVLPQNPNLKAEQESLTDFQLQVQQGYEQDTDWLDGLSLAGQAMRCEKQGFLVVWGCQTVKPSESNACTSCKHAYAVVFLVFQRLSISGLQSSFTLGYPWLTPCTSAVQYCLQTNSSILNVKFLIPFAI